MSQRDLQKDPHDPAVEPRSTDPLEDNNASAVGQLASLLRAERDGVHHEYTAPEERIERAADDDHVGALAPAAVHVVEHALALPLGDERADHAAVLETAADASPSGGPGQVRMRLRDALRHILLGGLIAAGLGIVLYNVVLSGLAIGLFILGFARPAPATA